MNIREIDWHQNWIRRVLRSLDNSLVRCCEDFEDGDDMLEHGNGIAGIAFVALQVYIRSAMDDLKRVFPGCPESNELWRLETPLVGRTGVSHIEAMWEAANYFKHLEGWEAWPSRKGRRAKTRTTNALEKMGVSRETEYRCIEVLRRLQGECWHLPTLLDTACEWREAWFARLKRSEA
jgi:hypothetical protein